MSRPPVILLASLVLFSSCGDVTETGNPCPTETCDQPLEAERDTYRNTTFGIEIAYPSGWTYTEAADGKSVEFTNSTLSTTANMSFERLSEIPSSLLAYLEGTYPGYAFSKYETDAISGYSYDTPEEAGATESVVEYFFLGGNVLVHVYAESPPSEADQMGPVSEPTSDSAEETGLTGLVDGISFE